MLNKIDVFLQKLHEEDILDLDLLLLILEKTLLEQEKYNKLEKCKIVKMLTYINRMFIYHFDDSDQSRIKNFSTIESIYTDVILLCEDFINILFDCGKMDYKSFLNIRNELKLGVS